MAKKKPITVTDAKPRKRRRRLSEAMIIAIIGLAGTLIAGLLGSPLIENWKNNSITPTIEVDPSITPTLSPIATGYISKGIASTWSEPGNGTLGKITLNQVVSILEEREVAGGKWFRCSWEINGTAYEGWILAENVVFEGLGYVNLDAASVWNEPDGDVVDQLNLYQPVAISEKQFVGQFTYYKCYWESNGVAHEGWVIVDYITLGPSPTP